uniref:AAA-type ATPase N-terminal domain-containing protein n=1 Tax=Nelumbo nucifera TaxID=4432 RepID=A0A822YGE5_NELNU|nr:TPA_asm: hypothetical protein HUJ06_009412 [Nelumbo nucifera]
MIPKSKQCFLKNNEASSKTILSTATSLATSAMLIHSIVYDFLPHETQDYIFSTSHGHRKFDGLTSNEIYNTTEIYLGTKVNPSTQRVKVRKPEKEKNFTVTMERNEEIVDVFDRVRFKWKFICAALSFHKKHKNKVLSSYFLYILEKSKTIKDKKKTLKLLIVDYNVYYDNPSNAWVSINLDHPTAFKTLAMEPDLKITVMEREREMEM